MSSTMGTRQPVRERVAGMGRMIRAADPGQQAQHAVMHPCVTGSFLRIEVANPPGMGPIQRDRQQRAHALFARRPRLTTIAFEPIVHLTPLRWLLSRSRISSPPAMARTLRDTCSGCQRRDAITKLSRLVDVSSFALAAISRLLRASMLAAARATRRTAALSLPLKCLSAVERDATRYGGIVAAMPRINGTAQSPSGLGKPALSADGRQA